jgi:beta-galactosidase
MKLRSALLCLAFLCFAQIVVYAGQRSLDESRLTHSFDTSWQFFKGDVPGAEQSALEDSHWRTLDVPHDWSIEGPFDEKNLTGGAGAFLPSGVAWYRKHFKSSEFSSGPRVFIEFDGVMQNSDIWINGVHLGHRPNGYVSLRYELTDHLKPGKNEDNVIAVRVDTSAQPASRWYSGAGIYRHVRLVETPAVHLALGETFVSASQLSLSSDSGVLRVQAIAINQSDQDQTVVLSFEVGGAGDPLLAKGKTEPQVVKAGQTLKLNLDQPIKTLPLWDVVNPQLLKAEVSLTSDKFRDEEFITFGLRDAHFEADTGFWLNGKNIKIKGVCLHHEAGAFGAAVPLEIWKQRLSALKELGVNAIRTAHNPPAPEFLDLCDAMGFLVMDEMFDCWTVEKNPYDYHLAFNEWSKRDVRDTVLRDRNHPSVILYSAGNEIHDTPQEKLAHDILAGLVETFHQYDPTRPVTQGLFRPNISHDYDNGLADLLDVVGTNYRDNELLAAYKAKPTRKIIGTEHSHDRKVWLRVRDNPPFAGQFLWTGIDYLGESRKWPKVAAASGLLDKTGAIKPIGWERASWWVTTKPILKIARRTGESKAVSGDPGFTPLDRPQVIFDDWTPRNQQPHEENVEVYSNCTSVELFLNDKSLGSKELPTDASPRIWKVPYAPGTLTAIARQKDKVVATDELRTAGPATAITLTTHRAQLAPSFDDVSIITATIVDAAGIRVPDAAPLVHFATTGPGKIAAVDNSDISNHEPFQATQHLAYQGTCVAYVRATESQGTITLKATADGLADGELSLIAR